MSYPPHPDGVAEALRKYQPKSLRAEYWASVRSEVLGIIAQLEPHSVDSAKAAATAVCLFLAECGEPASVAEVMTEKRVGAFLFSLGSRGLAVGYQKRLSTVLTQATRLVAGLPRRMPMTTSVRPIRSPLSLEELHEITGAHPEEWLKLNPRHHLAPAVRLTLDLCLLHEGGLRAALKAGLGQRRIDAAAAHLSIPPGTRDLLRG